MSKKINISKDFLIKEYVENGKSFNQIAKELNFAKTTIRNYCKTYNIKSKSISKYSKILTKDFLYNEYIINKKSIKQISLMVKLPITTISYNLKINKIKTRRTEGKNHPNYGNKGKYSFSFKGGQCSKKYFCLVCGKEISISSGFYGKGRCGSCASSTKSLKQWQNKIRLFF